MFAARSEVVNVNRDATRIIQASALTILLCFDLLLISALGIDLTMDYEEQKDVVDAMSISAMEISQAIDATSYDPDNIKLINRSLQTQEK